MNADCFLSKLKTIQAIFAPQKSKNNTITIAKAAAALECSRDIRWNWKATKFLYQLSLFLIPCQERYTYCIFICIFDAIHPMYTYSLLSWLMLLLPTSHVAGEADAIAAAWRCCHFVAIRVKMRFKQYHYRASRNPIEMEAPVLLQTHNRIGYILLRPPRRPPCALASIRAIRLIIFPFLYCFHCRIRRACPHSTPILMHTFK